jgi:predicted neuraminidase
MKQSLSIFFLSIFFLFQYGKMIDYMECRIAAAIESRQDCGCDAKLQATATDEQSSTPFHQHHLKNYTEEFFNYTEKENDIVLVSSNSSYNSITVPQQLSAHLHELLQPPRC